MKSFRKHGKKVKAVSKLIFLGSLKFISLPNCKNRQAMFVDFPILGNCSCLIKSTCSTSQGGCFGSIFCGGKLADLRVRFCLQIQQFRELIFSQLLHFNGGTIPLQKSILRNRNLNPPLPIFLTYHRASPVRFHHIQQRIREIFQVQFHSDFQNDFSNRRL